MIGGRTRNGSGIVVLGATLKLYCPLLTADPSMNVTVEVTVQSGNGVEQGWPKQARGQLKGALALAFTVPTSPLRVRAPARSRLMNSPDSVPRFSLRTYRRSPV